MTLSIQTILLLSLFSPLTEAFPNLYMSWWAPSNGRLQSYLNAWPRRMLVVFVVWLPILIVLSRVVDNFGLILLITVLIFSAFGFRLYVFDRYLKEVLKKHRAIQLSKIPEFIYVILFLTIGVVLYSTVPSNRWLAPVAILTIFLGASMISTFRRGKRISLTLDIIGRLIFVIGFLLFLYNLSQAILVV